jgi:hypothetical protein
MPSFDPHLFDIVIPVVSFFIGMGTNAYGLVRKLATTSYVDQAIANTHKLIDDKTNNCFKDCIAHSDRNRQMLMLELKEAMISVSKLSAKQDMILELIKQMRPSRRDDHHRDQSR